MTKLTARLEQWHLTKSPISGNEILVGKIYEDGAARFPDGMMITTSKLMRLDKKKKTAETLNTIYKLGKKVKVARIPRVGMFG